MERDGQVPLPLAGDRLQLFRSSYWSLPQRLNHRRQDLLQFLPADEADTPRPVEQHDRGACSLGAEPMRQSPVPQPLPQHHIRRDAPDWADTPRDSGPDAESVRGGDSGQLPSTVYESGHSQHLYEQLHRGHCWIL